MCVVCVTRKDDAFVIISFYEEHNKHKEEVL